MNKNQPAAPSSYATFLSKMDDALSKPIHQLINLALESATLARTILRSPTHLDQIAQLSGTALWQFVCKAAQLDEMLAMEVFRSPNRHRYLSPPPACRDLRELCLYHDDDLRVSLVLFAELIHIDGIDHNEFFRHFFKYLIEHYSSPTHYIKSLGTAFRRTAVLSASDTLNTLNALTSSLKSLQYKNQKLRAKHEKLQSILEKTHCQVRTHIQRRPPYLQLPPTLIAQVRFEYVFQFAKDVDKYSGYVEAIYGEECVWAQLVEETYQPIVLATMSYFEYYGRKTWVTRTLEKLASDVHNAEPAYNREQVIEDVIETLRELYLQGDRQAGIDYLNLAGKVVYQHASEPQYYPIHPTVAAYLLAQLKTSHPPPDHLEQLESAVLSLENKTAVDMKQAKKILSTFAKPQYYEKNETWDGRVYDIMKH